MTYDRLNRSDLDLCSVTNCPELFVTKGREGKGRTKRISMGLDAAHAHMAMLVSTDHIDIS